MKQEFIILPKDKVTGCYRIKETLNNTLVAFNNKVFRTKCLDKAIKKQLLLEEYVKLKEKEESEK